MLYGVHVGEDGPPVVVDKLARLLPVRENFLTRQIFKVNTRRDQMRQRDLELNSYYGCLSGLSTNRPFEHTKKI